MPTIPVITIDVALAGAGESLGLFFYADGVATALQADNSNASQTIDVRAGGGTFTVSFGGHTTVALPIGTIPS